MRDKIYNVLKKLYGITMTVAFFGGVLPLIPFIVAICIGGGAEGTGEKIAVWLYKQYYPWVIALASIAVLIGLIAMYVGGQEAFSTKSFGIGKKDKKKDPEEAAAEDGEAVEEAAEEAVTEAEAAAEDADRK